MAHVHTHGEGRHSARGLGWAFLLNLVFTAVEVVGGFWTNSAAILADAVHDLGDAIILGIAWYLQRISARGRDGRYSYGYGRYSMLGGWAASMVLLIGSVTMLFISVPRLFHSDAVDANGMVWIALFGLVMNGAAAWMLHGGKTLNERGVFLHLLEDVLGWAAVLIGAVLMVFTEWYWIDAVLAIAIALYVGRNAIGLLRKGTEYLMQALPERFNEARVEASLLAIPGVIGVHDQHAWTLDGEFVILTVHLEVEPSHDHEQVKRLARSVLSDLGVDHATMELEGPGSDCGLLEH